MKNLFSILILASFAICISTSQAQAQDPSSSKLNKKINNSIAYPLLAEQNMDGEVAVTVSVSSKGKLDVVKIDSSNPNLIPYVIKRLKRIEVPLNDKTIGSNQTYLLNFRSEAYKSI
jgi:hypothetical protein